MCGINGIISHNKDHRVKNLFKMNKLIEHRGPDGEGTFHNENVSLGHRRLSIIDLSERSNQPMISSDRYIVVYNGECYNFQDLKAQLIAKGEIFRTKSDTEVILKMFEHYGENFINKINGIFAIAIYDKQSTNCYLYRDRLGVKPLYIYSDPNQIIFSSEIKPILSVTRKAEVNESKLFDYFQYRYVPGNQTLFKEISSVQPGSMTTINTKTLNLKSESYWHIDQFTPSSITQNEYLKQFNELFENSCHSQLVSDVPVGVYLSGGIDSSTISFNAHKYNKNIVSYTIDINEELSELDKAIKFSNYLGIQNKSKKITNDNFTMYSSAINALEEPIGDSIIVPTQILNELVGKNNKVVLSGEGADELLNGYVHHQVLFKLYKYLKHIPNLATNKLSTLLNFIPNSIYESLFPYPSKLGQSGIAKVIKHFSVYDKNIESYNSITQLFYNDFTKYFNHDLKTIAQSDIRDYFIEHKARSLPENIHKADLLFWNTNYTLLRLDKLSMNSSVEARVPFLDHRLVEIALKAPILSNLKGNQIKYPLRNYTNNLKGFPKEISQRKKTPFFLPSNKTFHQKKFNSWAHDIISSSKHGYYNKQQVLSLIENNKELVSDKKIFTILMFDIWYDQFMADSRQ